MNSNLIAHELIMPDGSVLREGMCIPPLGPYGGKYMVKAFVQTGDRRHILMQPPAVPLPWTPDNCVCVAMVEGYDCLAFESDRMTVAPQENHVMAFGSRHNVHSEQRRSIMLVRTRLDIGDTVLYHDSPAPWTILAFHNHVSLLMTTI